MGFDNITAVVPVREGRKGQPDSSLLEFGDVTLLEWKIIQLKNVLPAKQIVLSTNSEKAIERAEPYGVQVVRRTEAECKDGLAFPEVLRGIIGRVKAEDIAICPCTAPMLGPRLLKEAFTKYNANLAKKSHCSLASVNEMREYLWDGKKPINYSCDANFPPANQLPAWYRVTNGLFMMSRERMLKAGYFLDAKPFLFIIDNLSGTDISHFEDYKITRELLSFYLSRESAAKKA